MKLSLLREAIAAELGGPHPDSAIEMRVAEAERNLTTALDLLQRVAYQVEGYKELMEDVDAFVDSFWPS